MIQTFECADAAWLVTLGYIKQGHMTGSRDGASQEQIGYGCRLRNCKATLVTNRHRKIVASYAAGETLWYLSGRDDVTTMQYYAPQYERFANDGVVHGAYGLRMVGDSSFDIERGLRISELDGKRVATKIAAVIQLLHQSPDTRQAVMTLYDGRDLIRAVAGGINDIPCTLALQFICRERKVHCIAFMRSNDAWLGWPYDVFAFTCIQKLVAMSIGMEAGTYTHLVGSMHSYTRDAAKLVSNGWEANDVEVEHRKPMLTVSDSIKRAVELEVRVRNKEYETWDDLLPDVHSELGHGTLLSDLVVAAATKTFGVHEDAKHFIMSPAIRSNLR